MNGNQFRAGVVGASGYAGRELVGLIERHPRLRLAFATSESEAGEPVAGAGMVRASGAARVHVRAEEAPLGEADVVFCCLPTGESGRWALRAREAGARVVDLSGDLRGGESGAVYGLTELWRAEVENGELVANPGCYPTGAVLGLAPAVRAGILDPSRVVVVDAASGVTGAGRSARREMLFGEVAEDYRAYGVGNGHRHVAELERSLSSLGRAPAFVFTPHLLPIRRGILETLYLPVLEERSPEDWAGVWSEAYAGERFVEVLRPGRLPSIRDVAGRNVVSIGIARVDVVPAVLLVVVALDNLLKGAAGQAVQNANLMLGLPEGEGLPA